MNQQECQEQLLQWYNHNKRDLPWRKNITPYRVWISEIMLQQTTVETVKPFFSRFMGVFDSLEKLSMADEDDVMRLWAGLGYYSRARNILKVARIVRRDVDFPKDFHLLIQLPGIGRYTAGAIASIAFNQPVCAIDVNVERVLSRMFALKRTDKSFNVHIQDKAQSLIHSASSSYGDWNQALIELGALICKSKSASCLVCPIHSFCLASQLDDLFLFPGYRAKQIKEKTEVVNVIRVNGNFVLKKVINGNLHRGLYDFPINSCEPETVWYSFSYRVSNIKMHRFFKIINVRSYQLQNNEIFFDYSQHQGFYPLSFPCKKYFSNMVFIS